MLRTILLHFYSLNNISGNMTNQEMSERNIRLLPWVNFISVMILLTLILTCTGAVYAAGKNRPIQRSKTGYIQSNNASRQDLKLLRSPTMSKNKIAFEYGGEIWEVPRVGGKAHVLASGMDMLEKPIFSPDGSKIAFTGTYEGNTDVYVVSASGGQPKRLTYHPGADVAVGWTPDGKHILFRSRRYSFSDPDQLYTVSDTGSFPRELPLSKAEEGSYSPDGSHIAYVPDFQWEPFWKGYKGGQHTHIWIAKLSNSSVTRVPNKNSNESDPMWVGNTVYFLSNRNGHKTLFSYGVNSRNIKQLIDNNGFDITSASAGPGGIVYSQFGQLHIYDTSNGDTHAVPVTVTGDMPQRRPYYKNVKDQIYQSDISPNGIRAVFEAHGDIFTVPAKHGSITNLTHSPGVMDRGAAWSPDGKHIAYFSDRDGEYDLYISGQKGQGKPRKIKLGQDNAYYYNLRWSPDSNKILFSDQKLNLWYVNLNADHPKPKKVDTDNYSQLHEFGATWSPDGQYIAYTKVLPNFMHAIFIYSLKNGKIHQLTNGMSDCLYPAFDKNGKYLYFTSSTNTALTSGWLDMTKLERPVTRHVYAMMLQKGTASPVAPKSGFEKEKKSAEEAHHSNSEKSEKGKSKSVKIDFQGLLSRTVALPVKPANYMGLRTGKSGELYLLKAPLINGRGSVSVENFNLRDNKTVTLAKHVSGFDLAANDQKMLVRHGSDWFIQAVSPHAKPDKLNLSDMRIYVKPHEQWNEMYHDAWRIERAFFYNPNYDGLNINKAESEFSHYLPGIASRDGLSFLFKEMMSYMAVGHMFIRGGHHPKMKNIKVGLLGANYNIEHNRYRITRIFTGGHWNPDLYAPLAQPGLKVKKGDYLLAVNGEPITGSMNIYKAFEDLANKHVTLTVGPNPSMKDSHHITVKTIPSEHQLRNEAWIDHNMQVVNKMSNGKLGYVYLPNTAYGGYRNFNRYFFSQTDKEGVIIDERYNHGGYLSDYIIQYLQRKPMTLNITRWGKQAVTPPEAIFGPKVMIINQFSGSGGDALPWYFKKDSIGTIVGERTWGGLVGIGGYPPLMDGGSITAPRTAVEGLHGTFPVENHGISPDVTVWQNPQKMRNGHDPQLERAVKIAMHKLKEHPPKHYKRPPWRNYHPHLPPLPQPNGGGSSQ